MIKKQEADNRDVINHQQKSVYFSYAFCYIAFALFDICDMCELCVIFLVKYVFGSFL